MTRVWAPSASRVEVVARHTTRALRPAENGWWVGEPLPAGCDYAFMVDGEGPFPDPRSRWQPNGVLGLSRVFDPAEFVWSDRHWTGRQLAGSIIYELHVGTFTPEGTFDAAISRLDHLVELGVTTVELLPVNAFSGPRNWGYDGVGWFAVHEGYGGPAGYQRFVDSCHRAGLAVIQDVVYNHLGPVGNFLPRFGPYLNEQKRGTTWGQSVNLDGPGSDGVRAHILDNVRMWVRDFHVDGLRLDAVHAFVDSRATTLLEQLSIEADALSASLGRPISLIAESDLNDPALITERAAGGRGMTAQWSDDFHHAVHVAVTGETSGYYADFADPDALRKVLAGGFYHDGTWSSFRERSHGRPIDAHRIPASRLVVSIQNHDQVGNRASGDRLSAQVDVTSLGIAAAIMLLSPFTPQLFMGEEWGASTPWPFFTSHEDPEIGEATRRGRVAEFARMGWDESAIPDPQDPRTFRSAQLDWAERETPNSARLLAWYRTLIRFRAEHPEVTDPRLDAQQVSSDPSGRVVVVRRGGLCVAINVSPASARVDMGGAATVLSWADDSAWQPERNGVFVTLPARSVLVTLA